MHLRKLLSLLTILLFSVSTNAQVYHQNGMVVSDNQIASEVGAKILEQGGNAIDATVATALALAVVHPQAGNIGGGGFIVYLDAEGSSTTFDFREKAPLAATEDMFMDENGEYIPMINHNGLLAVGVPGTVAGLWKAHQKAGSMPWADLVQPAVELAEEGFPLSFALAQHAERYYNSNEDEFMRMFYTDEDGNLLGFGDIWKQPELAETLKRIRDNGHDGFYKGETARLLAKHMAENGGIITEEDLAKYEAIERTPVTGTYKDYDIISMPPPSSGGASLIQMMNMMEQVNWDEIEFNSTEYVHIVAESMRRAYADRAEHMGDPDFNPDMPIDRLISKEHAQNRFSNIDWEKASPSDSSKFGQLYDGKNTTHFSVIDKEGNAVSLTYTLEWSYGARTGSPELGFILNNEMGDFNPVPGLTNSRGRIGSDPNLIRPEKRMLSSMTPTIIAKDGKPYLIIGTPGGRTIINTTFQTVLNVLEFEMPLDKAIEAMKIHHQWLPDRILYEGDLLSPDTRKALEAMGHNLESRYRLGRMMGIIWDQENGVFIGASDSSSPDGGVAGY
ncbi:MAG: gamma-glutamyltransferase [bacterium]|nr:gamma-glutamyltransferase [bacterium]